MKAEGAPHGIRMDELIVSVFIGTILYQYMSHFHVNLSSIQV